MGRLALLLTLLVTAGTARAEWGWYRGDIVTFSAASTTTSVPEAVHQAVGAGLDWAVLSAPPGAGTFVGLNPVVEEIRVTVPRLTPILGSAWADSVRAIRILGVDSRAPVPREVDALVTTVETHRGVVVLEATSEPTDLARIGTFSPVDAGRWSDAVAPGGPWDQALVAGARVFVATVGEPDEGTAFETRVWADGNQADRIIAALRRGSSCVADRGGPEIDLQVDGRTYGQTVFHGGEPFVRIRAHAGDPIARVSLVADGEVVWAAEPGVVAWEERFFLPAADHAYLRVVAVTRSGRRTYGNPIFLGRGTDEGGELPLVAAQPVPVDDGIEMAGAIEALTQLPPPARRRVLREFLSEPSSRYETVWLLQNRPDVVTDRLLAEIADTDPEPEARLGAAYALVTRSSELASDRLLSFLDDPDPSLQAYAARVFAHYSDGFTEDDWPVVEGRAPEAAAFLVRAYHPDRHAPEHVARIISILTAKDRVLADAANDKLVELGTRDYRVVQALVDAARSGSAEATVVLGTIGDHRTVAALQDVYANAGGTALRRAAFLALARMGAPHPDRPAAVLPEVATAPTVDGIPAVDEWDDAVRLADLRSDFDGAAAGTRIGALAVVHGDSVYLIVTRRHDGARPTAILSDTPSDPPRDGLVEISLAGPPFDGPGAGPPLRVRINAYGLVDCDEDIACLAVSRVTETAWHVELALPRAAVADRPRFNLSVVTPGTDPERLAWSVTYDDPANPARFGDLELSRAREGSP